MQQVRCLPLRRRRFLGILSAGALAVAGWGCQQPPCYYYYGCPPCTPAVPATSAAQYGAVSEVPTQVVEGGTPLDDDSGRLSTAGGSQAEPRVVVSEPVNRPRRSWRRPDPESGIATTSVEGAIDDTTINR
jgi:hypothetical protein